ncbi:GIY-YIG nuclease family protein [Bradyrhizobium diazoefficiens]|uniref:hypothetical protein n=1 Tax=Bradyrhizobium diazoefficiens TaxID=1355477 RepID=UPI001B635447|nr:putative GIY-YIG superfamily endonuclease [Bradyrhizobium japonicum]
MSLSFDLPSSRTTCTSKIFRPGDGITSPRLVHHGASRVGVWIIPLADRNSTDLALAVGPAAYVLMNRETAYFGETKNINMRFSKHFADPAKAFARVAYVVVGYPEPWSNKDPAFYLQYHLWSIAQAARHVVITNEWTPTIPRVRADERAEMERILEDARQQLFDAGCLALDSYFDRVPVVSSTERDDDPIGPNDMEPMLIDIVATPPAGGELELNYVGLWARGYPTSDRGFVVMPGAEFRWPINGSAQGIVDTRRSELEAKHALATIPGAADRKRLLVAVWFPSAAIAAKVITGAHIGSRVWVPRRYPQPIIIAN